MEGTREVAPPPLLLRPTLSFSLAHARFLFFLLFGLLLPLLVKAQKILTQNRFSQWPQPSPSIGAWMTNVIIVCLIKFFFGIVPGMSPELAWTMTTLTYNLVSKNLFFPLGVCQESFSSLVVWVRDNHRSCAPFALLLSRVVENRGHECSLFNSPPVLSHPLISHTTPHSFLFLLTNCISSF